jgi:hypothetical protein
LRSEGLAAGHNSLGPQLAENFAVGERLTPAMLKRWRLFIARFLPQLSAYPLGAMPLVIQLPCVLDEARRPW